GDGLLALALEGLRGDRRVAVRTLIDTLSGEFGSAAHPARRAVAEVHAAREEVAAGEIRRAAATGGADGHAADAEPTAAAGADAADIAADAAHRPANAAHGPADATHGAADAQGNAAASRRESRRAQRRGQAQRGQTRADHGTE